MIGLFASRRPSPWGLPLTGAGPCHTSDGAATEQKGVPAPRLSSASRWRREVRIRKSRRPTCRSPRVEIRPAVPHDASEAMKGGSGTVHPISLEGARGKPEKVRCPPRAQEFDRVVAHATSSARRRRRNAPPVWTKPGVREATATWRAPLACRSRCPTTGRRRYWCDRDLPRRGASSRAPSSSRPLHAGPCTPR